MLDATFLPIKKGSKNNETRDSKILEQAGKFNANRIDLTAL